MGGRKVTIGRRRKNAERKRQQLKLKGPGRPKKIPIVGDGDAGPSSVPNAMVY